MPNYDYSCEKCGNTFEVFHKMNDAPKINCPVCNSAAKKMITSNAGIIFKGNGFYVNDYKKAEPACENKSSSNPACAGCSAGHDHA